MNDDQINYAARLSWVCPVVTIITFALLILGGQTIERRTIALVASAALCLSVIGLILAIVGLMGISRHGTRGILAPAIGGIIINGLLLSIVFASFVALRARRMHQHGGMSASAVRVVWSGASGAFGGGNGTKHFFEKAIATHFAFAIFPPPFDPEGHGQHNLRSR